MPKDKDEHKPSRIQRDNQSLGWLSQSAVQPKKRKEIEGVGATSLVALQAQVVKTQQQAQLIKEGKLDPEEIKERRKGRIALLQGKRNRGVDDRNEKDRLQVKKTGDRLTESREALEKKARLYEQLAAGAAVDDEEKYEVDFLMKEVEPRSGAVDTSGLAVQSGTGKCGLMSADMEMERQRRDWEREVGGNLAEEQALEVARDERLALVEEIEDETRAGRSKAEQIRQQRLQAENKKRERLRAELLKRKLEKEKLLKEKK